MKNFWHEKKILFNCKKLFFILYVVRGGSGWLAGVYNNKNIITETNLIQKLTTISKYILATCLFNDHQIPFIKNFLYIYRRMCWQATVRLYIGRSVFKSEYNSNIHFLLWLYKLNYHKNEIIKEDLLYNLYNFLFSFPFSSCLSWMGISYMG